MAIPQVHDFGPIYFETDISRFPVEPFNTYSNLIFLFLVLLYSARSAGDFRRYPVTVLAMPILMTGFVGGTVFHATRSHSIWLFLDFIPIAVLVLLACLHFWYRLCGKLVVAGVLAPVTVIGLRWLVAQAGLPRNLMISLSYSAMAAGVMLPSFLTSLRRKGENIGLLFLATILFAAAVYFRINDSNPDVTAVVPTGTHCLWHLFGGLSTWAMLEFLFRDERKYGGQVFECASPRR